MVPTAPQMKAAVRPKTATMPASQYQAMDGRFLGWTGGADGVWVVVGVLSARQGPAEVS
jgi:hypothetical protein